MNPDIWLTEINFSLKICTCDGRNNGLVIMGSGLYYRSCNGIRPSFHSNFTFTSEVWDLHS